MKRPIINIIMPLALAVMTLTFPAGCGSTSEEITLDSLQEANAVDTVMQSHGSILQTTTYYENLDNTGTFEAVSAYVSYETNEDGSSAGGSYITRGSEIVSPDSTGSGVGYDLVTGAVNTQNYSWYIADNIEYYLKNDGSVTLYPLTHDYMKNFTAQSFVMEDLPDGKITRITKDGGVSTIIAETDADSYFTKDTLKALNELAGATIEKVRFTYKADTATLLLQGSTLSYVTDKNKELTFASSTISYDIAVDQIPSADFATPYIIDPDLRAVTVVEKVNGQDLINAYYVPKNVSVDFKSFTDAGYTIYADELHSRQFTSESPGENGLYPDFTVYAVKEAADADGKTK